MIVCNKPLLYWAVLKQHHWWIYFDQIELNRMRKRKTDCKYDASSVRRIAKGYSVNRGIRRWEKGKDRNKDDSSATRLACLLNKEWESWPELLTERAEHCCKIARDLSEKNADKENSSEQSVTRGVLVSAVTKLMWFLKPDGWTVFDSIAADGLNIENGDSVTRSTKFYKKLNCLQFGDLCKEGNKIIDDSALAKHHGRPKRDDGEIPVLYMERVFDSLLLLHGTSSEQRPDEYKRLVAYLEGYPCSYRNLIEGLADQLVNELKEELKDSALVEMGCLSGEDTVKTAPYQPS